MAEPKLERTSWQNTLPLTPKLDSSFSRYDLLIAMAEYQPRGTKVPAGSGVVSNASVTLNRAERASDDA
jgi:hypothetical protein